ncbi:hypothetical protein I7I51_08238 [Histoplasma capsulatum]|uniref:Uncharacterized protein n=1 Tax=Ajellomyces capsulatus TaxID=5037 RepID=A0A8A1LY33_AJECA|nr:hypothetical protein I7I51_08238 [Histoplasma capsulatum]
MGTSCASSEQGPESEILQKRHQVFGERTLVFEWRIDSVEALILNTKTPLLSVFVDLRSTAAEPNIYTVEQIRFKHNSIQLKTPTPSLELPVYLSTPNLRLALQPKTPFAC